MGCVSMVSSNSQNNNRNVLGMPVSWTENWISSPVAWKKIRMLIDKTGTGGCTIDELLTSDSDLLVYVEMDDDNCNSCREDEDSNDEDDATVDQESPPPSQG